MFPALSFRPATYNVGFEQQPGTHGIEDGLRRCRNAIDFKVFVDDQENREILGPGFAVTKLPQMKTLRSFPFMAASFCPPVE